MNVLAEIGNFLTGGIAEKLFDAVEKHFPPEMSEAQRLAARLEAQKLDHEHQLEGQRLQIENERAITERVKELEGTVKELKTIPLIGPVVIFTRAMQRQIWGYGTLYIDFMWFSGAWKMDEQQQSAMWVINLLILGFLFGERAIQNLAPLISDMMAKGRTNKA